MAQKYLIWDFDGTLAYRLGQWSGTMSEVLRHFAGLDADIETLRPFMQKGFPWHNPNQINPPMRTADNWWVEMRPVFESAFVAYGLPSASGPETWLTRCEPSTPTLRNGDYSTTPLTH